MQCSYIPSFTHQPHSRFCMQQVQRNKPHVRPDLAVNMSSDSLIRTLRLYIIGLLPDGQCITVAGARQLMLLPGVVQVPKLVVAHRQCMYHLCATEPHTSAALHTTPQAFVTRKSIFSTYFIPYLLPQKVQRGIAESHITAYLGYMCAEKSTWPDLTGLFLRKWMLSLKHPSAAFSLPSRCSHTPCKRQDTLIQCPHYTVD